MSQTIEDQRQMESKKRALELLASACPYDPNKGSIPTEQEKAEQARRAEALRRQAAFNAMTADQILPKGALIKINGRLFKVKASNQREVRLKIQTAR